MSISERERHELHSGLAQALGPERAATLMSDLPPVGWADVATKRDLDALEERIDLRFATKEDLRAQTRLIITTMLGLVVSQSGFAVGLAFAFAR